MNQSSKSLLESFDPFITHSFTNFGSGSIPRSARAYHPKSLSPELSDSSDSSSVASTDSNTSSLNSTPMHSPRPTRAPSMVPPPPPQIFERFRKDATTPELVLKKRLPQSKVVSRSK